MQKLNYQFCISKNKNNSFHITWLLYVVSSHNLTFMPLNILFSSLQLIFTLFNVVSCDYLLLKICIIKIRVIMTL